MVRSVLSGRSCFFFSAGVLSSAFACGAGAGAGDCMAAATRVDDRASARDVRIRTAAGSIGGEILLRQQVAARFPQLGPDRVKKLQRLA